MESSHQHSSLESLIDCWPGRESQILALHNWLYGRGGSHIVIHGPSGTGKTSVVRHCLEAWGLRHAYTALAQEYKLRQLLNAVLSALWGCAGHKRRRDAGWGAVAGADSWNEFAEHVAEICPPGAPRCSVLVLDNMEWHAHRNVMPQLLAAIQWHRASLMVVAITTTAPQELQYGPAAGPGLPLLRRLPFPAYDREQLRGVLAAGALPAGFGTAAEEPQPHAQPPLPFGEQLPTPTPSPELYADFLGGCVVDPFCPLTRSPADLVAVAGWLWPLYSRPIQAGQVRADAPVESQVRQLDVFVKRYGITRRLLEVYRPGARTAPSVVRQMAAEMAGAGLGPPPVGGALAAASGGEGGGGGDGGGALALNLGKAAKLLLLAAFIASRNKATLDKELFDFRAAPRGGRRARGGNRAGGAGQEADRQAEAAKEARLKGPHAFPLTRLISIFHRLWAAAGCTEEDGAALGGPAYGISQHDGGDVADLDLATGFRGGAGGAEALWAQSGAVLSSITGLQGMGMLAKHGPADDPLDQPRYTCALDEATAGRLAADVRLQLHSYLLYDR